MKQREWMVHISLNELANRKGISRKSLRRDINMGKLDIGDIEDICRWLREPRHRITKGKPIVWLEKKS